MLEAGTRKPVPDAIIRVAAEQEVTDSHGEGRFLRIPLEPTSITVRDIAGYKRYSNTFYHNREYATKFLEVELEPEAKPTGGATK